MSAPAAGAGLCQIPVDPGVQSWWTSEDPARRALAAALCSGCPALDACRQLREETRPTFGVWAGVDTAPRAGVSPGPAHGSEGGYTRHLRAREPACPDCAAAHRAYSRQWRARTRTGQAAA